ncbi:MAG: hypothetical protein AAF671_13650, partial [Pseudomonadota bacterium]
MARHHPRGDLQAIWFVIFALFSSISIQVDARPNNSPAALVHPSGKLIAAEFLSLIIDPDPDQIEASISAIEAYWMSSALPMA